MNKLKKSQQETEREDSPGDKPLPQLVKETILYDEQPIIQKAPRSAFLVGGVDFDRDPESLDECDGEPADQILQMLSGSQDELRRQTDQQR